jgi:hypothetical protein
VNVPKNAPVSASACLSTLPKNTLENFAKWSTALVREPLVRTPPLPPSAFVAIILTFAVAIAAMFSIDTTASNWAHHLPRWFIDAFEEITNFGLGGWFLIPSAFVFLCLAAVAAPTLPRITQGVLAALAARFGFLFLAVGAPGLFDTIIGSSRFFFGRSACLPVAASSQTGNERQAAVPLWKITSVPPRRRTRPGLRRPGSSFLFGRRGVNSVRGPSP